MGGGEQVVGPVLAAGGNAVFRQVDAVRRGGEVRHGVGAGSQGGGVGDMQGKIAIQGQGTGTGVHMQGLAGLGI